MTGPIANSPDPNAPFQKMTFPCFVGVAFFHGPLLAWSGYWVVFRGLDFGQTLDVLTLVKTS